MGSPAQNILYPDSDVYKVDWINQAGNDTNLWGSVDEGVFSPNDSDWVEYSGNSIVEAKIVFQMDPSNVKPVQTGGTFSKTGATFYARIAGRNLHASTLILDEIWWYDSNIKTISSGITPSIGVTTGGFVDVSGQMILASEPAGGWNMQQTYLHTNWDWSLTYASGIRISAMEIYNSGELIEFGDALTLFIKGHNSVGCYDELLDNLISYWKMDEPGQDNRNDSYGTNHLTVTGNGSVSQEGGATHITRNSVGFTHPEETVLSHPDNDSLSRKGDDFSICGWVKVQSKPGVPNVIHTIVDKSVSWLQKEYEIYAIQDFNNSKYFVAGGAGGAGGAVGAYFWDFNMGNLYEFQFGDWYHIGMVFSNTLIPGSSVLDLYLNGQFNNRDMQQTIPNYDSIGPFVVGGDATQTDKFLNGKVDELGFWKRALSSGEISLLYSSSNGLSYPFCPYLPLYIEGLAPTGTIPLYIAGTNTQGCNDELRNRLVSYWKMDELGGGVRYDSVSTNHLTECGVLGHQNGATHLTNKSVEMDYLNNASLFHNDNNELSRANDDISLFCWIRINEIYGSPGQMQVIVDKSSSNFNRDTEYSLVLDTFPNRFRGIMGDSNNGVIFDLATTTVIPNVWYHTGFTYVRSLNLAVSGSTVQTYLNGQLQSTISIDVSGQNNPGDFVVGAHNTNPTWYLDGAVDELGLWKRALNSGEVYDLYNRGNGFVYPFCPYLPLYIEGQTPSSGISLYIQGYDDFNCLDIYQSGLLAYWKLEEQTGTRYDSHLTFHLTDVSGVSYQQPGLINTAANLNRDQGQHLTISNQTGLSRGDNDFTIAGWCYLQDTTTNQYFIANRTLAGANSTTDYALWYNNTTGKTSFSLSDGSFVSTIESDWAGFTQAGYWYYVAGTYEKNTDTAQFYVNGQLQSSLNINRAGFPILSGDFSLGAIWTDVSYSGLFNGYLDEFAIWSRVLSSGEINRLYFGNEQYGLTYPFCPIQLPLYIQGASPSSGDITLFTLGLAPESGNITLYTPGYLPASGGFEPFTLFIEGAVESEFFPLFIKGKSPDTEDKNLPLYIFATPSGVGGIENNFPLYVGGLGAAGHLPLVIPGPAFGTADSSMFPLFIKVSGNLDGSQLSYNQCTLFVQNSWVENNNNITLFVSGDGLNEGWGVERGHLPLYINRGADNIGGQGTISLYTAGPLTLASGISLFLRGTDLTANSGIALVIPQVVGPVDSGIMLYTHAF